MLKKFLTTAVFLTAMYVTKGQTRSENLFYMVNTPESFESFRANVLR